MKRKGDTECSHEQNCVTIRIKDPKNGRTNCRRNGGDTYLSRCCNLSKLLGINVQFSFHKTMSHTWLQEQDVVLIVYH